MLKLKIRDLLKPFSLKSRMPKAQKWEIQPELFDRLSMEVLNEIWKEAEMRFNSTVDDIESLRSRGYTLVTVFISLLSILVSFYFGGILDLNPINNRSLQCLLVTNIFVIAYSIILLVTVILPEKRMLKGEEPQIMDFVSMASVGKETQSQVYLINSIESLQDKICFNEKIIQKKNQRLERAIIITLIMFVFTLSWAFIFK